MVAGWDRNLLMNSSKKKPRDCSHSWPSLCSPAKLDYISCYISIGSQPFDQVAPQVFVGRRLGSSEGPCNNIELVQFKGVRHFSLYLFCQSSKLVQQCRVLFLLETIWSQIMWRVQPPKIGCGYECFLLQATKCSALVQSTCIDNCFHF